jgi:serine protease Do
MVTRTKPGTTVPVELIRDGKRLTVQVTVAPLELDGSATGGAETSADTGLGMSLRDLTGGARSQLGLPAGRTGALVTNVEPGSPAARGGVRAGDVLLEVNRTAVTGAADAARALRELRTDTAFALVWRGGQELFLTMPRE